MDIQGFIRIPSFEDNSTATVAPLGELSIYSRSSSIEVNSHTNEAFSGVELVSFRNRGLITNTPPAAATKEQTDHILLVAHWAYLEALSGYTTNDSALFLHNLGNELGDKVTKYSAGEMVTNGTQWLPEWLSWSRIETDGDGNPVVGLEVKIWFCDESFRSQYYLYDIAFVLSVDNPDDFFKPTSQVVTQLNNTSIVTLLQAAKDKANKNPYTVIDGLEYDFYNSSTDAIATKAYWAVIVWGEQGYNTDVIRNELIEYLLANSTHERSDWEKVLPDLFISTEFLIAPNWDKYAVPNQTTTAGLYSPLFNHTSARELATKAFPTLTPAHLDSYQIETAHTYKSIGFVVCGGLSNRDKVFSFEEKFSDYLAISSTHVDFNRISTRTQAWIRTFTDALKLAEAMTEDSVVPSGYARLRRNGLWYLAFTYEKVQYLVLGKQGWNADTVIPTTGKAFWTRKGGAWVEIPATV